MNYTNIITRKDCVGLCPLCELNMHNIIDKQLQKYFKKQHNILFRNILFCFCIVCTCVQYPTIILWTQRDFIVFKKLINVSCYVKLLLSSWFCFCRWWCWFVLLFSLLYFCFPLRERILGHYSFKCYFKSIFHFK
jgi:hypothetical protein